MVFSFVQMSATVVPSIVGWAMALFFMALCLAAVGPELRQVLAGVSRRRIVSAVVLIAIVAVAVVVQAEDDAIIRLYPPCNEDPFWFLRPECWF